MGAVRRPALWLQLAVYAILGFAALVGLLALIAPTLTAPAKHDLGVAAPRWQLQTPPNPSSSSNAPSPGPTAAARSLSATTRTPYFSSEVRIEPDGVHQAITLQDSRVEYVYRASAPKMSLDSSTVLRIELGGGTFLYFEVSPNELKESYILATAAAPLPSFAILLSEGLSLAPDGAEYVISKKEIPLLRVARMVATDAAGVDLPARLNLTATTGLLERTDLVKWNAAKYPITVDPTLTVIP